MIRIGTRMPEATRRLIERESQRYTRLGEDLRRLAANTAPTPGELEEAPALTAWRISYCNAPILLGRVHGHMKLPTRTELMALIRAKLAGRAAEVVLLGEVSSGAGGSAESDLARATAASVGLVTRSGLSGAPDALVWRGHGQFSEAKLLADARFRTEVAQILATAHADAESLVQANAERMRRLAETLLVRGELGADEAKAVLLQEGGTSVHSGADGSQRNG